MKRAEEEHGHDSWIAVDREREEHGRNRLDERRHRHLAAIRPLRGRLKRRGHPVARRPVHAFFKLCKTLIRVLGVPVLGQRLDRRTDSGWRPGIARERRRTRYERSRRAVRIHDRNVTLETTSSRRPGPVDSDHPRPLPRTPLPAVLTQWDDRERPNRNTFGGGRVGAEPASRLHQKNAFRDVTSAGLQKRRHGMGAVAVLDDYS
jgi:hypothetical protein